MDSTGVLELIVFLEKRCGITVGDREIHPDYFDSIRRIAAFVERKISDRGEPGPTPRSRESVAPSSPTPLGGP